MAQYSAADAPRGAVAAVVGQEAYPGDLTLRGVEQRHIHAVLERMHGNKRRAARALGLSRSTLDRKLAADGVHTQPRVDARAESAESRNGTM